MWCRAHQREVEIDDSALDFLAQAKLIPGSNATVKSSGPEGVRRESDNGEHTVPREVALLMTSSRPDRAGQSTSVDLSAGLAGPARGVTRTQRDPASPLRRG